MNDTPTFSPVVMIYSQLSLRQIQTIFANYGDQGDDHGTLRIVRAKDERSNELRDTNRTIGLISKRLFDALINDGLHKPVRSPGRPNIDFRLVPYEVRVSNLPQEGLKKDLFIRLPRTKQLTIEEVQNVINTKMASLVKFGVLNDNQYKITVPLRNKDRQTGQVKGSCFLTFTDDVTVLQAALVKAVIDDTYWDPEDESFNCYWARDTKPQSYTSQGEPKSFYKDPKPRSSKKETNPTGDN